MSELHFSTQLLTWPSASGLWPQCFRLHLLWMQHVQHVTTRQSVQIHGWMQTSWLCLQSLSAADGLMSPQLIKTNAVLTTLRSDESWKNNICLTAVMWEDVFVLLPSFSRALHEHRYSAVGHGLKWRDGARHSYIHTDQFILFWLISVSVCSTVWVIFICLSGLVHSDTDTNIRSMSQVKRSITFLSWSNYNFLHLNPIY